MSQRYEGGETSAAGGETSAAEGFPDSQATGVGAASPEEIPEESFIISHESGITRQMTNDT